MTGDIFKGLTMNTLFNFVSKATGQGIHLLGMLTEAIHTPYLQDRHLAIANALYVHNTMADFMNDIEFKKDGIMARRARLVVDETIQMLSDVKKRGLFSAIETGMFAEIKRPRDGGKGLDGVYEKAPGYYNPVETYLKKKLKVGK